MKSFFIGLQFLTRIKLANQQVWHEEDFGRSVRYFPLVGLVLGTLYMLAAWLTTAFPTSMGWDFPPHIRAALLVLLPIYLTGGIHCDGFMDTMDGVFSGRPRERMLEIMKDSCTGAFAVTSFGVYLLAMYSVIQDMPIDVLPGAMLVAPIIGRTMMVAAICFWPYARPEGMGKAFAQYNSHKIGWMVLVATALVLGLLHWHNLVVFLFVAIAMILFAGYVTKRLGGLTGDVYGAICMLSELLTMVLLVFISMIF